MSTAEAEAFVGGNRQIPLQDGLLQAGGRRAQFQPRAIHSHQWVFILLFPLNSMNSF